MLVTRILGLRQRFTVEGVRYREVSTETLRSALSKKGRGFKEYDVRFPDGATMRISATSQRHFTDISGAGLLDLYRVAEPFLKPGMRVAILKAGTGAAGAWVARLVGTAGAVVALDRDKQSIRYARHRYTLPNISYEVGGIEALAGETAGAFNAAIALDVLQAEQPVSEIGELWRILGDGGALILAAAVESGSASTGPDANQDATEDLAAAVQEALADGPPAEQVSIFRRAAYAVAVARRRADSWTGRE